MRGCTAGQMQPNYIREIGDSVDDPTTLSTRENAGKFFLNGEKKEN